SLDRGHGPNISRTRSRADLLLVAVLLNGRRRNERGTRRTARSRDWCGHLRRTSRWRSVVAVSAESSERRRLCSQWIVAVRIGRVDRAPTEALAAKRSRCRAKVAKDAKEPELLIRFFATFAAFARHIQMLL